MLLFILGALGLLIFIAWATFRTAQFLRTNPELPNLLLLPGENLIRFVMILVCITLAELSGLPGARFGWEPSDAVRDLSFGIGIGILIAIILPPLTRIAIARFGSQVYSPAVIRYILPRTPDEWWFVPFALVPAVFLEEMIFRSLLLGGFSDFVHPLLLALIWSVIFGALHLPQGALGMIVAGALGLLFSILFLARDSILVPFAAHYVINLLQLVWASQDKTWLEHYEKNSRRDS
jgi:membrane protease YdiL (CAAX protease family)